MLVITIIIGVALLALHEVVLRFSDIAAPGRLL